MQKRSYSYKCWRGEDIMTDSTIPENFLGQATQFLQALVEWEHTLSAIAWPDLIVDAQLGHVALFSVDMINGFCHEGTLSSPRVKGIIPNVVMAFKDAYAIGVRAFVLAQ